METTILSAHGSCYSAPLVAYSKAASWLEEHCVRFHEQRTNLNDELNECIQMESRKFYRELLATIIIR
jgi:hypothetical protein